jgi:hypothetical protein
MAYPSLSSTIALTDREIDGSKVRNRPGVYVLGAGTVAGNIVPRFVGRSEEDLKGRLKQHVGGESHFAFAHTSSAMGAYRAECELFHHLKPANNKAHPKLPKGTTWQCPWCK